MEQVSIYKFYKFGELMKELMNINPEIKSLELYNKLANYYDHLDELKLETTKSASRLARVDLAYKSLKKITESKENCDSIVNKTLFEEILKGLNSIKITLEAEIFNKYAYVLTQKRYSNELLINDIFSLFEKTEDFQSVVPDIIKFHIVECGLCIAFDRSTAAAFHIFRATEEFIRFAKCEFLELEYETETKTNFFDLIKGIEQVFIDNDLKKREELINILHMIRKNYRNESQHSDRIFTLNESLDLLNLCVSAINLIFSHLDYEDIDDD